MAKSWGGAREGAGRSHEHKETLLVEVVDFYGDKEIKDMANQTAVKGTFEYQGQTWTSFWNGKDYNGTKYIIASRPGGSEVKITASPSKGISAGGSRSLDFAKLAYKSITGEDW